MHQESIAHMRRQFNAFVADLPPGRVLEVGSKSRRAEFRRLWTRRGWDYTGLDLQPGPNVDVVLDDPFCFTLPDDSFDAVISGQMLEHNTMFWLSFLEMSRVLKMGGIMIHVAPSRGPEHRAPTDCWRFYRDGMAALADWAGFELLSAETDWSDADIAMVEAQLPRTGRRMRAASRNPSSDWGDTVGVFRKTTPTQDCKGMHYVRRFAAPQGIASVSAA